MIKYLIIMLLAISGAYAFTLDNIIIESTGLNTTIIINQSVTADLLQVEDSYIYFGNLTINKSTEYIIYNINITLGNITLRHDNSILELPHIGYSDNNNKIINYTYFNNININTSLRFGGCNVETLYINGVTYVNNPMGCVNNTFVLSLPAYNDSILINANYFTDIENSENSIIYSGSESMGKLFNYLPLIILALIVVFVVFALSSSQSQDQSIMYDPNIIQYVLIAAVGLLVCVFVMVMISQMAKMF